MFLFLFCFLFFCLFPEFGFILQYRNYWSHCETDIIEAESLSNQYCVAAWSAEEATPGLERSFVDTDIYIYIFKHDIAF